MGSIKDHVMIGGPSAIAGWGLLVLLIASGGISGGHLRVDLGVFILILVAAASTGNGVYALNAYYDRAIDKINKPGRPIPSGRMTPEHAYKYSIILMVLGLLSSLAVSVLTGRYLTVALWSIFTFLGIAYSMPPVKLKARHIFGNLCFAAFAALTFTISSVVFGGSVNIPYVFLISILVVGLITMKDFHDYEGDKAKGDVTFPVKVGKLRAAAISMALMTAFLIIMALLFPQSRINPWVFFQWYWSFPLIPLVSFGVYMAIEHFGGSTLSNAYSKAQYYFTISVTAYFFLRGPLGLNKIAWLMTWDKFIALSLYTLTATAAVYMAWKKGRVPKPT